MNYPHRLKGQSYKERVDHLTQGEIDALIEVYGKKLVRGWFPMHKQKIDHSTARKLFKGKKFLR